MFCITFIFQTRSSLSDYYDPFTSNIIGNQWNLECCRNCRINDIMRNYHLLHQAKKKISLCLVLLFNSLDKLQTKPLPPIRHICDFSRGVLNVRFMRSHPTLAPRPQICLIEGNGFCAVAGEGELNRRGDWGTEADVFCLLENDWE